MRARTLTLTTILAGAATVAVLGAGAASAVAPIAYPQAGAVGVELNNAETQAFANGPAPALIDHYLPGNNVSVGVRADSQLPRSGNRIVASMRDIAAEAASRPNGHLAMVVAPGPQLIVVQQW
ncbi:hypothetical protein [Nocardia sp. NPDC051570]|uniref:hypothetical protein n=1 Tax=Nocardia sp. NPDC051570 TaxID=3364324 RepID=UPI0037AFB771